MSDHIEPLRTLYATQAVRDVLEAYADDGYSASTSPVQVRSAIHPAGCPGSTFTVEVDRRIYHVTVTPMTTEEDTHV